MECASKFTCFKLESNQAAATAPKVDINVIEINLGCLNTSTGLATGDPCYCKGCRCLLNSSSILTRSDRNFTWICEFCKTENSLTIEEGEVPTHLELTYMLEAATHLTSSEPATISTDSTAVVFCIDTSGSMATIKRIAGRLELRNKKNLKNENFTNVTRLDCIQAAVDSQMNSILSVSPQKKVGLILFNSKVTIIGDGSSPFVLSRDCANSFSETMALIQSKQATFLSHPICESLSCLIDKLFSLRACGGTALGPALLCAVLLASEGGSGSKVVMCTDGLANEGIGALAEGQDQEGFYREIASIASDLGVSVSVISIEGQECRLESLALVTDLTGGNIVKVAPEALLTDFSNMISEDVIATKVTVEVFLHKSVRFQGEPLQILSKDQSTMRKFIGNSTSASSFSFHYSLKSDQELAELGINKLELKTLPFQALFTYTTLDGRKCLRSITKIQPVKFGDNTDQEVNVDLLARAGRRKAVKLAEEGRLEEAKESAMMWKEMLKEEVKGDDKLRTISEFDEDVETLTKDIDEHLKKEVVSGHVGDTKSRRKDYGDDFIIGMNKMKNKKY